MNMQPIVIINYLCPICFMKFTCLKSAQEHIKTHGENSFVHTSERNSNYEKE